MEHVPLPPHRTVRLYDLPPAYWASPAVAVGTTPNSDDVGRSVRGAVAGSRPPLPPAQRLAGGLSDPTKTTSEVDGSDRGDGGGGGGGGGGAPTSGAALTAVAAAVSALSVEPSPDVKDSESDEEVEAEDSEGGEVAAPPPPPPPPSSSLGREGDAAGDTAGHVWALSVLARRLPRLEFEDPTQPGNTLLLYRAVVPDGASLSSVPPLGPWVVLLLGGGHFAGVVVDAAGVVTAHKSVHHYTTRRKQGGSQAAADAGGGGRAQSAGATLRRHGEAALRADVRGLLTEWRSAITAASRVFVVAPSREAKELLFGWDGSPLSPSAVTRVPFPTRRATFGEAKRVAEQLATVWLVEGSMLAAVAASDAGGAVVAAAFAAATEASTDTHAAAERARVAKEAEEAERAGPKEKGTAHLKARDPEAEAAEKERYRQQRAAEEAAAAAAALEAAAAAEAEAAAAAARPIDPLVSQLLATIVLGGSGSLPGNHGDGADADGGGSGGGGGGGDDGGGTSGTGGSGLPAPPPPLDTAAAAAVPAVVNTPLHDGYTAARRADVRAVRWLLAAGADPVAGRPYLATTNGRVRLAFRLARGTAPDAWDWDAAGVGPPLTPAEAAAAEATERARRRKRNKAKFERVREAKLDAADPGRRARELRAAAAEKRLGLRK
ncbi:hypothetical protein MMPV_001275 [Pyropia vietnamensis]